jgi:hypothetical protein
MWGLSIANKVFVSWIHPFNFIWALCCKYSRKFLDFRLKAIILYLLEQASILKTFSRHVCVNRSICHCCTGSNTVRALFSKPPPSHLQCARRFLRSIFAVTMVISFLSRFASLQILPRMSGQEWYMSALWHENLDIKLCPRNTYVNNMRAVSFAIQWLSADMLALVLKVPRSMHFGVTWENNCNLCRKIRLGRVGWRLFVIQ